MLLRLPHGRHVAGAQGAFLNDTHLLNTATRRWHTLTPVGSPPAPRYAHACVPVAGRVLIHGGSNAAQSFDGVIVVSTDCGREINRCAGTTFGEHLSAHVFCGITISVMPVLRLRCGGSPV